MVVVQETPPALDMKPRKMAKSGPRSELKAGNWTAAIADHGDDFGTWHDSDPFVVLNPKRRPAS